MFSGKTEELIRRVKRALLARQRVQAFKPRIDDRYDPSRIVSHSAAMEGSSAKIEAVAVATSESLEQRVLDEFCRFQVPIGIAQITQANPREVGILRFTAEFVHGPYQL